MTGPASTSTRGVSITLDRERRLAFTFNALCDLEAATGKTVSELISQGIGIAAVRGLRRSEAC